MIFVVFSNLSFVQLYPLLSFLYLRLIPEFFYVLIKYSVHVNMPRNSQGGKRARDRRAS